MLDCVLSAFWACLCNDADELADDYMSNVLQQMA